jgi:hypothetical protein
MPGDDGGLGNSSDQFGNALDGAGSRHESTLG